jgi:hypothetical protein
MGLLSKALIKAGRPNQGFPYLEEAIEKYQAAPLATNRKWSVSASIIGECLTLLKRYHEAERFLTESCAKLECHQRVKSPSVVVVRKVTSLLKVTGDRIAIRKK